MSSLNVIIFSEDFPPYPGGIAQWAYGIANSLFKASHKIKVFTRFREEISLKEMNKTVLDIKYIHGKNWKKFRTSYCYGTIKHELESEAKPDVILATTWNFARGIIGLTKKYNVQLITVVHGLEVTRRMSFLKRGWLKYTLKNCSKIIAVSAFTKNHLTNRLNIDPKKVIVLPNGVDPEEFVQGDTKEEICNSYNLGNTKSILTLARVVERKGHDDVIRALPCIIQKFGPIKYIISGPIDENYGPQLRKLVSDLNLNEYVIFTGKVSHEEKVALYNFCNIYIMASKELRSSGDTEGFGITYLEANACGKPVIGGRSGGVSEAIIDGQTGLLVEPGNVDDICEKLLILLNDETLCKKLGDQGKERIEKLLTWDRLALSMMKQLDLIRSARYVSN